MPVQDSVRFSKSSANVSSDGQAHVNQVASRAPAVYSARPRQWLAMMAMCAVGRSTEAEGNLEESVRVTVRFTRPAELGAVIAALGEELLQTVSDRRVRPLIDRSGRAPLELGEVAGDRVTVADQDVDALGQSVTLLFERGNRFDCDAFEDDRVAR